MTMPAVTRSVHHANFSISATYYALCLWWNKKHSASDTLHTQYIPWNGLLVLLCFYPRPVLAFGYCRCLRLCVCVCLYVCQSRVCQRDNSSPVQARIIKFGAQMQTTLVKVPVVLWGDRPWPSRSNLTWKSNFTSFWACPDDNLSSVQARVTKFGPKMHLSTVKILIDLGVDQSWSSGSILT